jgi:hypothetical protein
VERKLSPQGVVDMAGYIRYQTKNGVEYAVHNVARRVDGIKRDDTVNLGRVIDKQRGIYRSRERGTFSFTLENGFQALPNVLQKGILDFGNAFVLHQVLQKCGFIDIMKRVFGGNFDSVAALVFYRILQGGGNSGALDWYDGSYAKALFPNANLHSQRLSELVKSLGDSQTTGRFFDVYLPYIKCSNAILIDSTGLPNAINMPFTAISNHNGQVNEEARYILIHDKENKMPIYYRGIPGNVVDVSTLTATIKELSGYGVNVDYALLDAGYSSENNVKDLFRNEIRFVTRLGSNRSIYKALRNQELPALESRENLVKYRERLLYIKRVESDLYGNGGFTYVALDVDRKYSEFRNYILNKYDEILTDEDYNSAIQNMGVFMLISSEKMDISDVLPIYYQRQEIEQMFDVSKNNAELLPLRVHDLQSFRGHLLVSFVGIVAYTLADKLLANSKYSLSSAFNLLRNLKITVFDENAVVQELTKKMKEVVKYFGVAVPQSIPCGEKKGGN